MRLYTRYFDTIYAVVKFNGSYGHYLIQSCLIEHPGHGGVSEQEVLVVQFYNEISKAAIETATMVA